MYIHIIFSVRFANISFSITPHTWCTALLGLTFINIVLHRLNLAASFGFADFKLQESSSSNFQVKRQSESWRVSVLW